MKKNKANDRRIDKTIRFFETHTNKTDSILDLGTPNKLAGIIESKGFSIINTEGQDLDLEYDTLQKYKDISIVTAFEILEHLVNPFEVLRMLPSNKLIATVPLRLWFASSFRNNADPWDRHFHEFEDWQFDWLLEKAGWKIIEKEKWTSYSNKIGFRPILRYFTPRYYAVYAERY